MRKLDKPAVSLMILLLLLATSAQPQDQPSTYAKKDHPPSTFKLTSPIPPIPCLARADAVIADTGRVFADEHSLVDSYQSSLGEYGGANIGSNGNVQAAGAIVVEGGTIRGSKLENSPAGLLDLLVPTNARPLPLGAHSPGRLNIHDHHDSITLRPGNYVAKDVDLDFPGAIDVFPSGLVSIFVTGHLSLGGHVNSHGSPKNLQFIVLGDHEVHLQHHGKLVGLLYAPKSEVELHSEIFGSVVGRSVKLDEHAAVHYDQSSVCPAAPPATPAIPPAALPPPPPAKVGCYVNTRNGWKDTPCDTDAFIDAHFPHPDTQLTMTSSATNPLVFGQLEVTIPQVTSENNAFVSTTSGIPGCQSTGNPIANQWSVQSNTNQWTVPTGSTSPGDTAATQFVIQSDGSTSGICVWNVDVTSQDYSHRTCVSPNAQQRSGGLQAFDSGNLAATMNSNGTMSLVAQLSWVPSGQPDQYGVTAPDTYGLGTSWNQVSGGLLGIGNCSQAQLANAEVITQVLASTCAGDTQTDSPVCAPPLFQPNASVFIGSTGTVETNNLTALGTPSLSFLNSDLAVSNITATSSGSCLGPSHAYVKDSAEDFGATPSTIGNQVFWESPDIFLVPHGTPVDLTSISTESIITPGGQFDIWVRLHNDLGCSDVTNAKALVYLADPSALSVQWVSITGGSYVGDGGSSTGVTVPTSGQALIGPLPFTAPTTGIGDGHKCLLAAIQADSEPAPTNSTDAPDSNQVAQRNIQFVGPCEYPLTNGTTSNANVQITLTVTPNTGATPSLTGLPNVSATFDDADSSWFSVWNAQPGNGTAFTVTHNGGANSTTVRLGAFSVALNPVPLAASQSRNLTSSIQPVSGSLTVQFAATLTDSSGTVLVTNGGSCNASVPVIQ
jgi:hypothetical protein